MIDALLARFAWYRRVTGGVWYLVMETELRLVSGSSRAAGSASITSWTGWVRKTAARDEVFDVESYQS